MNCLVTYRPLVAAFIAVMLIAGCRGDGSDLVSSTTGGPATPAPQSALPGLPSLPSLDKSTISTVAGVGPIGDGAPATSARLAFPMGLARIARVICLSPTQFTKGSAGSMLSAA